MDHAYQLGVILTLYSINSCSSNTFCAYLLARWLLDYFNSLMHLEETWLLLHIWVIFLYFSHEKFVGVNLSSLVPSVSEDAVNIIKSYASHSHYMPKATGANTTKKWSITTFMAIYGAIGEYKCGHWCWISNRYFL